MSQYVRAVWPVLKSFNPDARKQPSERVQQRFGAFVATYRPPGYGLRRPRTSEEAQKLYNHIRTVAFWLDAAPLLSDLGLPFQAGWSEIIALVPLYGDLLAGVLQLYQVYLSFLFGVSWQLLGWMVANVVLNTVVGLVPLLGDYLDFLFKANLRNLKMLEDWLLTAPSAQRYSILLMPETKDPHFIPRAPKPGLFASWKSSSKQTAESAARAAKGVTRRMTMDEGLADAAGAAGTGTGSAYGPESSAGKRREPAF